MPLIRAFISSNFGNNRVLITYFIFLTYYILKFISAQIKTSMRHHFPPFWMAIIKKVRKINVDEDVERLYKMVQLLGKTVWQFIKKLSVELPYNFTPQLISRTKENIHTKTCTQVTIIVKKWKPPKRPSTHLWINKTRYVREMEHYVAIKRNKVPIHAKTWMEHETSRLSERSQAQKTLCYMCPFTWHIQHR